jgi:pentatricopeptide repeat protein
MNSHLMRRLMSSNQTRMRIVVTKNQHTSTAEAVMTERARMAKRDKTKFRLAAFEEHRKKQLAKEQLLSPSNEAAEAAAAAAAAASQQLPPPMPPPPNVVPMEPVEEADAKNLAAIEAPPRLENQARFYPTPEMLHWQHEHDGALSGLVASLERAFAKNRRAMVVYVATARVVATVPPLDPSFLPPEADGAVPDLVPYVVWTDMLEMLRCVQLTAGVRAATMAARALKVITSSGCTRNVSVICDLLSVMAFGNSSLVVEAQENLTRIGMLGNPAIYNALMASLARSGETTCAVHMLRAIPESIRISPDASAALMIALEQYVSFDSIDVLLRQWLPTPPMVVYSALVRVLVETQELSAAMEVYHKMLAHYGPCMDAFHAIIFALLHKDLSRSAVGLDLIADHRQRGLYLSPAVLICERKLARRQQRAHHPVTARDRGQTFARELSLRTIVEERYRRPYTKVGSHIEHQIGSLKAGYNDLRANEFSTKLADEIHEAGKRTSYAVLTEGALIQRFEILSIAVEDGEASEAELPALFIESVNQLSALGLSFEALCALKTMFQCGFQPRPSDFEPILEAITTWDGVANVIDYREQVTTRYKLFRNVLDHMARWSVPPPPNAFMMLLRFAMRTRRFGSIVSLIDSMRTSFAPLPPIALWRVLHRAMCEDSFSIVSSGRILDYSRHGSQARYQEARNLHIEALILNRLPSLASTIDREHLRNEINRDLPTGLLNILHRAGRTDASVLPEFVDYFAQLRHHVAALAAREFRRTPWQCYLCRRTNSDSGKPCTSCGASINDSLRVYGVDNAKRALDDTQEPFVHGVYVALTNFPQRPLDSAHEERYALMDSVFTVMKERGMRLSEENVAWLMREFVLIYLRRIEQRPGAKRFGVEDDIETNQVYNRTGTIALNAILPPAEHMRVEFGHVGEFVTLDKKLQAAYRMLREE